MNVTHTKCIRNSYLIKRLMQSKEAVTAQPYELLHYLLRGLGIVSINDFIVSCRTLNG